MIIRLFSIPCILHLGPSAPAAQGTLQLIEGGVGIFGFAVLANFLDRFFGFCTEKLRFFGFGICCGLRFFRFLAFGFRFSAKIQEFFRIWYLMWFSVFPIWFPVMRLNCVGGRASRITPGTLTLH